jgi:hypothetical protein
MADGLPFPKKLTGKEPFTGRRRPHAQDLAPLEF